MEDTTPHITFISRRKSAKAASDAFAGQLDSDSSSEAEAESSTGKRRASGQLVRSGKKLRTKNKPGPVNMSSLAGGDTAPRPPTLAISTQATESTSTIASSAPNVANFAEDKSALTSIQLAQIFGSEELSDLTSLSSDEDPPSPDDVEPKHKLLAKPFPLTAFQQPISTATTSILTFPKPMTSILTSSKATTSRVITPKSSTSAHIKAKGKPKPIYKEFTMDSYVWTLVKPETLRVYDDQAQDEEKGLWWPGKIQRCRTNDAPLEVRLFGEGAETVQITSPSKDNIIPQSTPFTKMKFKDPTYVSRRALYVDQVSSINVQDSDQEGTKERWKAAVKDMKRDAKIITIDDSCSDSDVGSLSATDDEDLPVYVKSIPSTSKSISAPPKALFSQGNSKGVVKKKWKDKEKGKIIIMEEPDVLLEIPGELVLARDRAHTNIYWPAKIEAYVPAAKPTQPGKYTLTWVDSSSQHVPRNWFYIFSDAEFATCEIGKYDSFYVEKEDDPDEDDLIPPEDRSLSPVPLEPPPSQEDFRNLTIREQFAYTKGVLRAILDGRYMPSRQKHEDFVKGGKWRKNVTNSAAMWGLMDPKDVKSVDKLVQKWCMRGEDEYHTMDIIEDHSQEPIVIDRVQEQARLDNHEAPSLPITPQASGNDTRPDSTAIKTTADDNVQEESQSVELSLPLPTFNHHQPAESTLPSTSTDDAQADSTTLDPSAIDQVQEEQKLGQSIQSTVPDLALSDYVYPDSAMRFESPSRRFDSSPPPEMPPSSFVTSLLGPASSSQSDVLSDAPFAVSEVTSSPPPSSFIASTLTTVSASDDVHDGVSDLTAMEDDQSTSEVIVAAPKERIFVPFESLTQLVKIEYCSTILVPEAVRQILLWRSGDRTQVDLLTLEEEQILYDKGTRLLAERDWVLDVVRLREKKVAALKAMRAKSLKAMGGGSSMSMNDRNGSLSRPKRNLSVLNYQE